MALKNWNPTGCGTDTLDAPLSWKRPALVSVEDDLFRDGVKEERILCVFVTMGRSPQHSFFLKTLHLQRAKEILDRWRRDGLTLREGCGSVLPNVGIGTVVTNQYDADCLIPLLIRTRAAKRWLSIPRIDEAPLSLTSLKDLSRSVPVEDCPERWDDYDWPDWVPLDLRRRIEGFWSPSFGRSPRDWMREGHQPDGYRDCIPAIGTVVAFDDTTREIPWAVPVGTPGAKGRGRYVHCWNNMGRVVTDDGSVRCVSVSGRNYLSTWTKDDPDFRNRKMIDLVLLGQEGPSSALDSLREECAARAVPVVSSLRTLNRESWNANARKKETSS